MRRCATSARRLLRAQWRGPSEEDLRPLQRRHARQKRKLAGERREPALYKVGFEIAADIIRVIGLVEIVRKEVEQAGPLGPVALLQRFDDHHQAAGLEHPRHFLQGLSADLLL